MKHAGLFDPVEPEVFLREAHIGAAGAIEGEAAVARAVQRDHGDGGVFGGIQDQARRVDADAIQHALEPAADEIVTGLGEKRPSSAPCGMRTSAHSQERRPRCP